jgi:hypothetical protein
MIIAINTARHAPSRIDPMHRFELTTCYRLACGASSVVRSDTLVNNESPQCVSQVWEINEADIQLTDTLYLVAQAAMRRGYYMPNRGSVHCSVISVHTGAAVSRILAASWNREGIPAPQVEPGNLHRC